MINYIFYFAFALAIYKTAVLVRHHFEDDNVFAVVGDAVSILVYLTAVAILYFFF